MLQRAPTAESYDHYYGSGLYDARYPRPNPPTYRSALRLARTSSRILDFGAGSGRYTMPFLQATDAFVCAYDISADAYRALDTQAAAAGVGSHRLLVTDDLDAVRAAGPYDLAVALFGVLSHIEGKENRIDVLSSIRSVLSQDGLLLLTVPHALRRFPFHVSSDRPRSEGGAPSARARARRYFPSARPVSIAMTSRMRRGRFLITYSPAASLSLSFPQPASLWKPLNQTASCRSEGWFSGRRWRLSTTCCAVFFHHGPVTDCELSAEPGPSDRAPLSTATNRRGRAGRFRTRPSLAPAQGARWLDPTGT